MGKGHTCKDMGKTVMYLRAMHLHIKDSQGLPGNISCSRGLSAVWTGQHLNLGLFTTRMLGY
jgi:hypothetical protein